MTKKLKITLVTVLLIITSMLSSCAMFLSDHETFEGGEILNDELLSEIRSKVFSSDVTETEEALTEIDSSAQADKPKESAEQSENDDRTDDPNTDSSTESKAIESTEDDQSVESERVSEAVTGSGIVYWTENGEVWHLNPECRYLKNKAVISGSEEEAAEAGKKRVCSTCSK